MIDSIIHYFDTIPNWHRTLILVGGIMFFWILEGVMPLFKNEYNKIKHAGVNFLFTATTLIVNFLFALSMVKASDWVVSKKFGLLFILDLPVWVFLLVGLLLLDFIGAYLIHLIEHKVKWMWKFHMVHHADTHVDTTTANRHHPGESVFRASFAILAVLIIGAPMWLVFLYQSCSVVLSQFNHANIRLPEWIDKGLSLIIVSPNMHKVHHHYMRPQTDSNYGNIFSIWDRMLGTFNYTPVEKLRYGLDVLEDSTDENIGFQFKVPFNQSIKTDY
jgi:sterol desaturase/sphingolipid hydroxylase (fatty acid hydroxylase superfamily)